MDISIQKKYKSNLKTQIMPAWLEPMLATLTSKTFSHPSWIYECKFDGIRALIFKNKDSVKIFSRNKIDISENHPELVESFRKQSTEQFIIDGEIVAFKKGITSFSALQKRLHISGKKKSSKETPVIYYVFDILYLDKYLLDNLPLLVRKDILHSCIEYKDPIRLTHYIKQDGTQYYQEACKNGWEGVIAKKADSTYQHKRSKDWLKFKCIHGQEFVIGGYTSPKGKRKGFGALLLGYYDGNKLKYAGKVGTGFNHLLLIHLKNSLDKIKRKQSPFDEKISEQSIHWIKPQFIAEIGFSEWTMDGKLRHPRFKGLRFDKAPHEVVREEKNEPCN